MVAYIDIWRAAEQMRKLITEPHTAIQSAMRADKLRDQNDIGGLICGRGLRHIKDALGFGDIVQLKVAPRPLNKRLLMWLDRSVQD